MIISLLFLLIMDAFCFERKELCYLFSTQKFFMFNYWIHPGTPIASCIHFKYQDYPALIAPNVTYDINPKSGSSSTFLSTCQVNSLIYQIIKTFTFEISETNLYKENNGQTTITLTIDGKICQQVTARCGLATFYYTIARFKWCNFIQMIPHQPKMKDTIYCYNLVDTSLPAEYYCLIQSSSWRKVTEIKKDNSITGYFKDTFEKITIGKNNTMSLDLKVQIKEIQCKCQISSPNSTDELIFKLPTKNIPKLELETIFRENVTIYRVKIQKNQTGYDYFWTCRIFDVTFAPDTIKGRHRFALSETRKQYLYDNIKILDHIMIILKVWIKERFKCKVIVSLHSYDNDESTGLSDNPYHEFDVLQSGGNPITINLSCEGKPCRVLITNSTNFFIFPQLVYPNILKYGYFTFEMSNLFIRKRTKQAILSRLEFPWPIFNDTTAFCSELAFTMYWLDRTPAFQSNMMIVFIREDYEKNRAFDNLAQNLQIINETDIKCRLKQKDGRARVLYFVYPSYKIMEIRAENGVLKFNRNILVEPETKLICHILEIPTGSSDIHCYYKDFGKIIHYLSKNNIRKFEASIPSYSFIVLPGNISFVYETFYPITSSIKVQMVSPAVNYSENYTEINSIPSSISILQFDNIKSEYAFQVFMKLNVEKFESYKFYIYALIFSIGNEIELNPNVIARGHTVKCQTKMSEMFFEFIWRCSDGLKVYKLHMYNNNSGSTDMNGVLDNFVLMDPQSLHFDYLIEEGNYSCTCYASTFDGFKNISFKETYLFTFSKRGVPDELRLMPAFIRLYFIVSMVLWFIFLMIIFVVLNFLKYQMHLSKMQRDQLIQLVGVISYNEDRLISPFFYWAMIWDFSIYEKDFGTAVKKLQVKQKYLNTKRVAHYNEQLVHYHQKMYDSHIDQYCKTANINKNRIRRLGSTKPMPNKKPTPLKSESTTNETKTDDNILMHKIEEQYKKRSRMTSLTSDKPYQELERTKPVQSDLPDLRSNIQRPLYAPPVRHVEPEIRKYGILPSVDKLLPVSDQSSLPESSKSTTSNTSKSSTLSKSKFHGFIKSTARPDYRKYGGLTLFQREFHKQENVFPDHDKYSVQSEQSTNYDTSKSITPDSSKYSVQLNKKKSQFERREPVDKKSIYDRREHSTNLVPKKSIFERKETIGNLVEKKSTYDRRELVDKHKLFERKETNQTFEERRLFERKETNQIIQDKHLPPLFERYKHQETNKEIFPELLKRVTSVQQRNPFLEKFKSDVPANLKREPSKQYKFQDAFKRQLSATATKSTFPESTLKRMKSKNLQNPKMNSPKSPEKE